MTPQEYTSRGFPVSLHIDQSVIDRAERDVIDAYIRPIVPDYGKYFDEKMILNSGDLHFTSSAVTSDEKILTFVTYDSGVYTVSNSLSVKNGDIVSISSDRHTLNIVKYHEYKAGERAERVAHVQGSFPYWHTATYKVTEDCLVSFVGSQSQSTYEVTKSSAFTDATIDDAICNLAFMLMTQRNVFVTRSGAKEKTNLNSRTVDAWETLQEMAHTCAMKIAALREQPYANKDAKVSDICRIYFNTNFFYD